MIKMASSADHPRASSGQATSAETQMPAESRNAAMTDNLNAVNDGLTKTCDDMKLPTILTKPDIVPKPSVNLICQQLASHPAPTVDPAVLRQIVECTWVQCENTDCLKWRRLNRDVAGLLDDDTPWYCAMNPDTTHNRCADPQEDYTEYERLIRKNKLRYVTSVLNPGTLVWAKVHGYCRWPGIICDDPVGGGHVSTDYDKNPLSYHVEFLGEKHSHSWVPARNTDLYGQANKAAELEDWPSSSGLEIDACGFTGSVYSVNRMKRRSGPKPKERKRKYRGHSVDSAIQEADRLLTLSSQRRLARCVFKPVPKKVQCVEIENVPAKADVEEVKKKSRISRSRTRTKSESAAGALKKSDGNHHEQKKRGRRKRKSDEMEKRAEVKSSNIPARSRSNDTTTSLDNVQAASSGSMPSSPAFAKGKESLAKRLNTSASLMGRTKEEKFTIDVQMYRKNEAAFEHDLRRFMMRHECPLRKPPCWQGMPISLFSLFVAVYDRGGYEEVCRKRQWVNVYKELTADLAATSGTTSKKYYVRNLLPYELYATGGDYKSVLTAIREEEAEKERQAAVSRIITDVGDGVDTSAVETSGCEDEVQEPSDVLGEIENYEKQCEILQAELPMSPLLTVKQPIVIYSPNRSPPKHYCGSLASGHEYREANTAQEFGNAAQPEDPAQRVPDIGILSPSSGSRLADQEEQVIHEMKCLQQELDLLHEAMQVPFYPFSLSSPTGHSAGQRLQDMASPRQGQSYKDNNPEPKKKKVPTATLR